LDYGWEYDPDIGGDWSLGTPEGEYGTGERSLGGDIARFFGRGLGAAPYGIAQAGTHGLASLWENLLPGQQLGGNWRGPEGQLLAKHLGRDPDDPSSFYDPSEKGWSGLMRKAPIKPSADEAAAAAAAADFERRASGSGRSGSGGSMYQDLFAKIDEYEEMSSIPTESEKNRIKLDADRASLLRDRRTGIEALMPTEEQYGQRKRGVGFGALSKVLARTGDPRKRQDFGQIGEDIRGELDRQLGQKLGFEEKLAGVDTDIYGVEGGSLDKQATREQAGRAFWQPRLSAMQSELEGRQSMAVARLKQQQEDDYYRVQNIPPLITLLNDPTSVDFLTPQQRQIVVQNIAQRLTGGGNVPPEVQRLMQKLQGGGGGGSAMMGGMGGGGGGMMGMMGG
tara:strand:+ start:2849 stop:4030 length:1182 start_codon:yes stop_codon:yes gene_type:complete